MFIAITDGHRAQVQKYGTLVARIFMGGFFLLAGLGKIGGQFAGTVGYAGSMGVPTPELAVLLTIIIEIGAGLMLIVGWHVGHAAAALIGFTVLATGFFHHPGLWDPKNPTQQIMFMKNLAIIGGLLYMLGYGAGTGPAIKDTCCSVTKTS